MAPRTDSPVRLAPALPTCTCGHTAAGHHPRNAFDAQDGVQPCWVCGACRDYKAANVVDLPGALLAWLIETYGCRVAQLSRDWERDAGALLAVIEAAR